MAPLMTSRTLWSVFDQDIDWEQTDFFAPERHDPTHFSMSNNETLVIRGPLLPRDDFAIFRKGSAGGLNELLLFCCYKGVVVVFFCPCEIRLGMQRRLEFVCP